MVYSINTYEKILDDIVAMCIGDIDTFDEVELHCDCTVQILKNSMTGEVSVGWWPNN